MNDIKPPLIIYGGFGYGFGQGEIGERLIEPMEKLGYDVYINDYMVGTGPLFNEHLRELYNKFLEVKDKPETIEWPQILCYGSEEFDIAKCNFKLYLAFINTDSINPIDVENYNKYDCILTSTPWSKGINEKSGVTVPVRILPPNINIDRFPLLERKRDGNEPFTFLHIGDTNYRKNQHQLIDGYIKAFPDDGRTRLILKATAYNEVDLEYKKYMYTDMFSHRKDITFVFSRPPLTHDKLLELYQQADCYINISHGEGLGMPDMEALATGLPVIGINWDARSAFLDNEVGWMVDVPGMEKTADNPVDHGKWATINHFDYTDKLKYAASHPEECKIKGMNGAERIQTQFTTEKTAVALDEILYELDEIRKCKKMYETDDEGARWYVPSGLYKGISLASHERGLIEWCRNKFPNGGLFLDVGANVGTFSVRLAKCFREVVAVEPHPVNVYMLKKNMELNNVDNVRILEIAASRNLGLMFFNQMNAESLASAACVEATPNQYATSPPFHVMGVPLDDYKLNPDLIKMDIEGGEYEAIYGLRETLARSKPIVLIEIHQFKDGRNVGRFQSTMAEFGYKCTAVIDMTDCGDMQLFHYVYEYMGER